MSDVREVWLPVPDYEGLYEVSNLGRIRRDLEAPARSLGVPGKCIAPVLTGRYLIVSLSNRGVVKTCRLHRLVLTAFCGAEPFEGAQACHNDGDPENCALSNLRWGTGVDNQHDRIRHGTDIRGADVFGAKLDDDRVTQIRRRLEKGEVSRTIAEDYGVSVSTISLIRRNRIWRHVA
ncbi:NUMOD4 domain-containing protein [Sphingobium sp. B2]|uniref:NUMOD4 domain-containing protein n=1 Tax=Sphingobium sp. B2 TaxID=2583228 RepID=UPI00119DFBC7